MRQLRKLAFRLMLLAIVVARVGHAQVVPGVTINFDELSSVPLDPTVSAVLAAALAGMSVFALRRKRRMLGTTLALAALVAVWPALVPVAGAQSSTILPLVTSPVHAEGPTECHTSRYYVVRCDVPAGVRFVSFVPDQPNISASGECTNRPTLAYGEICELIVTRVCNPV